MTAAARPLDGQEARAGKSRFFLKPHPRRPKLILSFSSGFGHYWLLPLGQRSGLRHRSGECCQVLEGTGLAITSVPFVACASVVSVLLAGRFLRYICAPGKA